MTRFHTGPVRIPRTISQSLTKLVDKKIPTSTIGSFQVIWCTVVSAYPDPVQLVPDGPNNSTLLGVPSMLCRVSLGDRVLVLLTGRRMYVLGIAQPDQSIASGDTGWITDGINITGSTSWTVSSYACRMVGSQATVTINATYTGAAVTVDSTGNIADMNGIINIPPEWSPSTIYGSRNIGTMTYPGVAVFWLHPINGGRIDLVFGLTGATLPTSAAVFIEMNYFVD